MNRIDLTKGKHLFFLKIVVIISLFLFYGCSGDTGDVGPQGGIGPEGPAGTPGGAVVKTDESCIVCHTSGKIADIAEAHPDPTGQDVTVSGITLTNTDGVPKVSFHVATATAPVADIAFSDLRFYIADLVPAGTATSWGTWSSPYFERWASETSSTVGAVFSNDGGGNYTYTFATAFGSASALAESPEYSTGHSQRLLIRVNGHQDSNGNALTNPTIGTMDFVVPAAGSDALAIDSQRMFVTTDACKKCHGPQFAKAAHASGYLDTRACVICHSPVGHYGTTMQNDSAYLSVFIHKIHAAIDIPKWTEEGRINGLGYSAVTYPQEVKNCETCHTTSGLSLGTGDDIDNWKTHPTIEVCSSCHTDVNFATGENHPGGAQSNAFCVACHPASGSGFGKNVPTAHDVTPTGVNVPEYDVTLQITPPANGTYYVAGEAPVATVTLKDHATGLAVDPSIYTTAKDTAGIAGGGLSVASLYVYGPRAKSLPVLAKGTVTDSTFDATASAPTQGHDLFMGGSDSQVTTDSSGFRYQLLAVPAGMTGTYMVRVRIGDYGRVGTGDYHIESLAFTNIQIGTATEEKKVAGDSCTDCHGTGTAPFHDERHAVVFDTDECLSCHDQSENYAIPIANRVHAVHSANSDGDIYTIEGGSRDWADVTYPQETSRCVTCHSSNNTAYKMNAFMMPCAGCHVGSQGVLDHMRQNGGPF